MTLSYYNDKVKANNNIIKIIYTILVHLLSILFIIGFESRSIINTNTRNREWLTSMEKRDIALSDHHLTQYIGIPVYKSHL